MEADFNLLKPTPGGYTPQAPTANSQASIADSFDDERKEPVNTGVNPLVACANPLLYLAGQLRATPQHANPAALREYLAERIRAFEDAARTAGVRHEHVIAGRYVLCTLLDEVAASTPWGGSGIWAKHSLLVMFHNETWGGEKFYQLLSKLGENPVGNRDLLELMYLCLCLGFEGRYRVLNDGAAQLELLRRRLVEMLRQQRPVGERELSPHWQGEVAVLKRSGLRIPLWVTASATALLLTLVYMGLSLTLNRDSDPVFGDIQSLRARVPTHALDKPAAVPRLAGLLQREISEGLVSVADHENRSVITIRGDGLFESGSADVTSAYMPVLARISAELGKVNGQILISGHTDNQPLRSMRFPSNWHLSRARAEAVRDLLAESLPANRLLVDGRSDSEPVVVNDTPANRARNRRVEITLFVSK
ncbi:DotU family type VI secretion system protein [Chitinimonas arctica]|uniref:DotU family type VI secretion system protein n=1 Tax=Chitinimonas arctica TaxID=2594795 RepID=A0A516SH78_9NEIS|nr:DotU family type VI secretion system protein [Chitinimonas arctica]QDQ27505.1 DotU family type VI secretion system protein [Chitinimonas arctica]